MNSAAAFPSRLPIIRWSAIWVGVVCMAAGVCLGAFRSGRVNPQATISGLETARCEITDEYLAASSEDEVHVFRTRTGERIGRLSLADRSGNPSDDSFTRMYGSSLVIQGNRLFVGAPVHARKPEDRLIDRAVTVTTASQSSSNFDDFEAMLTDSSSARPDDAPTRTIPAIDFAETPAPPEQSAPTTSTMPVGSVFMYDLPACTPAGQIDQPDHPSAGWSFPISLAVLGDKLAVAMHSWNQGDAVAIYRHTTGDQLCRKNGIGRLAYGLDTLPNGPLWTSTDRFLLSILGDPAEAQYMMHPDTGELSLLTRTERPVSVMPDFAVGTQVYDDRLEVRDSRTGQVTDIIHNPRPWRLMTFLKAMGALPFPGSRQVHGMIPFGLGTVRAGNYLIVPQWTMYASAAEDPVPLLVYDLPRGSLEAVLKHEMGGPSLQATTSTLAVGERFPQVRELSYGAPSHSFRTYAMAEVLTAPGGLAQGSLLAMVLAGMLTAAWGAAPRLQHAVPETLRIAGPKSPDSGTSFAQLLQPDARRRTWRRMRIAVATAGALALALIFRWVEHFPWPGMALLVFAVGLLLLFVLLLADFLPAVRIWSRMRRRGEIEHLLAPEVTARTIADGYLHYFLHAAWPVAAPIFTFWTAFGLAYWLFPFIEPWEWVRYCAAALLWSVTPLALPWLLFWILVSRAGWKRLMVLALVLASYKMLVTLLYFLYRGIFPGELQSMARELLTSVPMVYLTAAAAGLWVTYYILHRRQVKHGPLASASFPSRIHNLLQVLGTIVFPAAVVGGLAMLIMTPEYGPESFERADRHWAIARTLLTTFSDLAVPWVMVPLFITLPAFLGGLYLYLFTRRHGLDHPRHLLEKAERRG